ncbi:MAG: hypothetical protein ABI690_08805 [Chloroflexota bacterium]
MVRRLLLFLCLSMVSLSVVSAQNTWKMTSAQFIGHVIGTDFARTSQPYLSPDGSAVAWYDVAVKQFDVYDFDKAQTNVFPLPENCCAIGRYFNPSWSPDSRYISFTESAFDRGVDSDIWMLDRSNGEITDRTDDGLFGNWLKINDPFNLDYLPTWNPANGDLYFFRSNLSNDGDKTLGLYLMPVGRDEPKLVADLTAQLPVLSVYRPAVISPDGTQIGFIVLGNDLTDARNGVWVMDLKSGAAEQTATVEALRAGLPSWQTETALFPDFLEWAGNNALVVLSRDNQISPATGIGQMAYYVDIATQTVTPLAHFEDVTSANDLYRGYEPGSAIYRIPRSGVVAPDGSAFFFLRFGATSSENAGISMLPLPPDGSDPVEVGAIDGFGAYPAALAPPVISSNGKALIYGYVLQFEQS